MNDLLYDLVVSIGVDAAALDKGIDDAKKKSAKGGSSIASSLGGGLKKAAKIGTTALAGATAAVVAFSKSAVDSGREFDSAMSQVAATMGVTMDEMNNEVGSTTISVNGKIQEFNGTLREFAQTMGANTAFSATECAEALNYMALAGYDAQTSMDMLPNVLNLAAAGSMDLATASDMVTDAQTALGLTQKQTNEMVDQMAKTSSKTNTSVEQLGDAMLTIGANAKSVSGGTQELTSVLGALADNGIKGSEAGTHLRNIILALGGPKSKSAASAMESLGLSYDDFYTKTGKLKDTRKIFLQLNSAMEGMTDQEKSNALKAIFNKTDLAAVNSLLGTSEEKWKKLDKAIGNASGSAQQMADTQLDNLDGDIKIFQSALEGIQIALSDELTPDLRKFVKFGSDGISKLTNALSEKGLSGAMSEAGDIISDGLIMAFDKLPNAIKAGEALLASLFDGIIDALPGMLDAAVDVINAILDNIAEATSDAGDGNIQKVGEGIISAISKIKWDEFVIDLFSLAELIVNTLANTLMNFGEEHPEAAAVLVTALGGLLLVVQNAALVAELLPLITTALAPLASTVLTGFIGALVAAFAGFSLGQWIGEHFVSDDMKQYSYKIKLTDFLKWDKSDWADFWQAFADWWLDVEEWWKDKGQAIKDAVAGIWTTITDTVKNGINTAIIKPINTAIDGWNGILSMANDVPGVNISKIDKIPELAKGGTISRGGMAVVGEAGAELINMPSGASVTPINSKNNALSGMMDETNKRLANLEKLLANQSIVLDTGVLVGHTASKMDKALGKISDRKARMAY